MRTYDITLSVSPDMPIWPGDSPTELYLSTKESGGGVVNVSRLSMSAHAGTHVDAPDHFLNNGKTHAKWGLLTDGIWHEVLTKISASQRQYIMLYFDAV